jgi:hypothetical protein
MPAKGARHLRAAQRLPPARCAAGLRRARGGLRRNDNEHARGTGQHARAGAFTRRHRCIIIKAEKNQSEAAAGGEGEGGVWRWRWRLVNKVTERDGAGLNCQTFTSSSGQSYSKNCDEGLCLFDGVDAPFKSLMRIVHKQANQRGVSVCIG